MSTMRKRKRNGLFYSKGEETVNSLSHGIGISMAVIIGGFFLIKCYRAQDPWAILGMWLYLFGMGGSYLSSTLYHSLKHHNPWKRRLRHWDHAAIYWHIAGSFSPITLIALRDEGLWGWGLFCFVWLCAVAGTIISFRKMEEHSYVETVCYILMGLSVQAAFCRCARILLLDYRRRSMLYRRCGVVFHTQRALYALGVSFLRIGGVCLPPRRRVVHSGGDIKVYSPPVPHRQRITVTVPSASFLSFTGASAGA